MLYAASVPPDPGSRLGGRDDKEKKGRMTKAGPSEASN